MVVSCCITNCTSRHISKRSVQEGESHLSFHRFPTSPRKRFLWVNAVRRVDRITKKTWQPSDNDRVCGRHFITGKCLFSIYFNLVFVNERPNVFQNDILHVFLGLASKDPKHPDYIPHLRMGHRDNITSPQMKHQKRIERYKRAEKRLKLQEKHVMKAEVIENIDMSQNDENVAVQEDSNQQQQSTESTKHGHVHYAELYFETQRLKALVESYKKNCIELNEDICQLKKENQTLKDELKKKRFSGSNQSDESMKFYTG